MFDQTMISFILIFLVAPLAFLLWAVCATVNALARIARATELMVDQQLGYADASRYKQMHNQAYAYVPTQAGAGTANRLHFTHSSGR